MSEIEERILRDFLGDLIASKGEARKVIIENIVTFVKKAIIKHSEQGQPDKIGMK